MNFEGCGLGFCAAVVSRAQVNVDLQFGGRHVMLGV